MVNPRATTNCPDNDTQRGGALVVRDIKEEKPVVFFRQIRGATQMKTVVHCPREKKYEQASRSLRLLNRLDFHHARNVRMME